MPEHEAAEERRRDSIEEENKEERTWGKGGEWRREEEMEGEKRDD